MNHQESVGVDFGIKSLATLSNGESFPASQPLKKEIRKFKKLQRNMSRKVTRNITDFQNFSGIEVENRFTV